MTVREPDSRPAGTPSFGVPVRERTAPGYRTMATKLLGQPLLPREATAALCRRAIVAGEPFALAKLGPSMLAVLYLLAKDRWLASGEADRIIHWHGHNQSGLFPEDAGAWQSFARRYREAASEIDVATVQLDLSPIEVATVRELAPRRLTYSLDAEPDRSIPDRPEQCFLPALQGRRVLIVCPFARLLAERAERATFEAVWARTGKRWLEPATVDALEFPYGFEPETERVFGNIDALLQHICDRIDARDFDVALIGAAGLAMPVAAHVKRRGRVAIDLGGHLQVLFGVKGKRWRNDPEWAERYFNDAWIEMPKRYRPTRADVCDCGAYW